MLYYEEYKPKDKSSYEIDIYSGNKIVGFIKKVEGYHETCFCVNNSDNRYIGQASTFFKAKKVFEKWYSEQDNTVAPDLLPASPYTEFYPTPGKLAGKMFSFIDMKKVNSVLEPSAGKGDLIESFLSYYRKRHYFEREFREGIDVIEIDSNLQHILTGKKFRLVADDFLSFNTNKRYDLIIMNPPFSNGDEHLLKALELQKSGGQIVCLLNAETIRNPFTMRRKILLEKLSECNAKIHYVKEGFKNAERKTDVEVAIVYVNIPAERKKSFIYDNLKKAKEYKSSATSEPTAIVGGNWLERMVSNFELEAQAGTAFIEEYYAIKPYIMAGYDVYDKPIIDVTVNNSHVSNVNTAINDFLEKLRLRYWRELVHRKDDNGQTLESKMTTEIAERFHDTIQEMKDYDFNYFNAERLVLEISSQLTEGVKDSIEKLFDTLSSKHSWYPESEKNIHYYNGWKTNLAHKVGNKCVIPSNGAYADDWWTKKGEIKSHEAFKLISDLERALNYLRCGDTVSTIDIMRAIECARNATTNKISFTYFDTTFYKKGTCHIKFNEQGLKLIDRLNIFAARNRSWLPPNYGKVSYDSMNEEEKSVIDDFQGKAAYEKVMKNPEKYIVSAENSINLLSA